MFCAPVYYSLVAISESVIVKFFESTIDNFYNIGLECKLFARPIAGCTKPFSLSLHDFFIFLCEIPDFFPKILASDFKTAPSFFFEFFVKDNLRFKTGMVRARKPKCFFAEHPVIADHNILQSYKNRVPDMQGAVRVRWGHYY